MPNAESRLADALERIATALEALARGKDKRFRPALPDPNRKSPDSN